MTEIQEVVTSILDQYDKFGPLKNRQEAIEVAYFWCASQGDKVVELVADELWKLSNLYSK